MDVGQAHPIIRRCAVGMLALVAVAAGATTLVGFLARWAWPPELLCHFRIQYFWALVFAAAGLAALNRGRWALVPTALAAVNLALIAPLYFAPAPRADGERFRALLLNVFWRNHDHAPTLALIERERPDFVVLLEITPNWLPDLDSLSGTYPYRQVYPRDDSGGIALLSRWPIVGGETPKDEEMYWPRIVARLQLPAHELTVIAAHPASPGSRANFSLRNQELRALGRIAARQKRPTMLLADLNTTSWSPYFQDLLRDSRLIDSRRGFGVCPTWPGLPLPFRIPIDHCLVSGDIVIHERTIAPAVGSDHRGVIIEFSLTLPAMPTGPQEVLRERPKTREPSAAVGVFR